MGLFDFFLRRKSSGIPASEAPERLAVSVAMVKELISIYHKRGFPGDPRVNMIGKHLWQLGGDGSLHIAKEKVREELGDKALSDLEDSWGSVKSEPRDPTAAREILMLEKSGMITDAMFRQ